MRNKVSSIVVALRASADVPEGGLPTPQVRCSWANGVAFEYATARPTCIPSANQPSGSETRPCFDAQSRSKTQSR